MAIIHNVAVCGTHATLHTVAPVLSVHINCSSWLMVEPRDRSNASRRGTMLVQALFSAPRQGL